MSIRVVGISRGDIQLPKGTKVLKAAEYKIISKLSSILDIACERSDAIIEQAKQTYEREKQRGFDEGVLQSKMDQSEQMLKMVGRSINYLAEVEGDMADILMNAVKKIIGGFDDRELTVGLIRSALQHVRNERQVSVRIPPGHYTYVKEKVSEILADYKGVGFINPVSDPRLESGSCILESQIGVVDASIDIQLEALKRRFEHLSAEAVGAIKRSESDA
ncbi:MAG: HrpE/YscL family type III secretion apparatus protein [Endozoicomonadaceae bacterium]|nr:HrpE/YscL family type III secretion apparatus protein [Endozoicomonadaceae bacterium]